MHEQITEFKLLSCDLGQQFSSCCDLNHNAVLSGCAMSALLHFCGNTTAKDEGMSSH